MRSCPYLILILFMILSGTVFSVSMALAERYPYDKEFSARRVKAALERTEHRVVYDGSYWKIPYPGGDVPDNIGVCSDVVIRAYRKAGIDLQKEVHEDMEGNFSLYPKKWGLKKPDTNIDHRRVPNLRVFFQRAGVEIPRYGEPGRLSARRPRDVDRPGHSAPHRHRFPFQNAAGEAAAHLAQYRPRPGSGGHAFRLSHNGALQVLREKIILDFRFQITAFTGPEFPVILPL